MFDVGQLAVLSGARLREAVAAAVRGAIEDGSYTLTEHHLSPEPFRTIGFEYLDSIKPDGNGRPIQDGSPETWDGHSFLILSLDQTKGIKIGVMKDTKVPGTQKVKKSKVLMDLGPIAEVPEVPGNRWARQLIYQKAWPVLQTMGDRDTASVVEWAWLEKDAKSSNPAPGVVELYEQLKPYVDAYKAKKNGTSGGPSSEPKTEAAPEKKRPGRPPKIKNNDNETPGSSPVGV